MSTCLLPKFWIGLLRTRSLFFFRVAFPRLVRLSIRSPICAFTGSSFGVSFNIESRFSGVARPTSTAIGAHHLHRAAGDGPVPDDVTHHTVLPTSSAISSPPAVDRKATGRPREWTSLSRNPVTTKTGNGDRYQHGMDGVSCDLAVAGSATGRSTTAVKGGLFLLENSAN